jgi:hypothetical protein
MSTGVPGSVPVGLLLFMPKRVIWRVATPATLTTLQPHRRFSQLLATPHPRYQLLQQHPTITMPPKVSTFNRVNQTQDDMAKGKKPQYIFASSSHQINSESDRKMRALQAGEYL